MSSRKSALIAPKLLVAKHFLLRPIQPDDARLDHEAVMDSREILLLWEQTGWPETGFSEEDNRQDLQKLERRHLRGEAYCFTMMDLEESQCLGCVYIFPTDVDVFARSQITSKSGSVWSECSAAIYFWVRQSKLAEELDRKLIDVLRNWMKEDWNLPNCAFVTSSTFKQQMELMESAGLKRTFSIEDPKISGEFVAYCES